VFDIDATKVLGSAGENYDRVGFASLVKRNLDLYKFKNGETLDTTTAANYIRTTLA
jgi:20S proteasome alpha/beta subunit